MVAQQEREKILKHTNDIDPQQHEKEDKLNGTFISVLLLGAFIAVSWLGIFLLFINRV